MKRFAILSGPSCVGKGPLQKAVRKLHPGLIDASPVLCTSRAPRKDEVHGAQFYFLPAAFIISLKQSADFLVSPVRTDWQAIHLPEVEELLSAKDLVFAEVFYTFGPELLQRAASRHFESIRVFLLPEPMTTPSDRVINMMREKLERRKTDSPEKIADRSSSAPTEIKKASAYTHRIVNRVGEDDVDEWGEFGTRDGKSGTRPISDIGDLGSNARWLVDTFVEIVNGRLAPGDYER